MHKKDPPKNGILIETKRLLLKPLSMQWKEVIFREFTEEITLFMFPRAAKKMAETEDFIVSTMEKMKQGKEIVCVTLEKQSEEFLGCAGLHEINTNFPELGIWLKKSAHGKKYGREAITDLKQWADEHLTYDHIVYPVDRDNIASRKIPESLGGVIHREYEKKNLSGNTLHTVEYWISPARLIP